MKRSTPKQSNNAASLMIPVAHQTQAKPTCSNPLLGNQSSSCRSRENQVQNICVYIHTHTLPPPPSHAFDSHQAGSVCQLRPAVPHKRARDYLRLLCGVHSQHIPSRHGFPVWGHPKSLWFFPTLPGAFSLYSLQDEWLHRGMQQLLTKISPPPLNTTGGDRFQTLLQFCLWKIKFIGTNNRKLVCVYLTCSSFLKNFPSKLQILVFFSFSKAQMKLIESWFSH